MPFTGRIGTWEAVSTERMIARELEMFESAIDHIVLDLVVFRDTTL